MRGGFRGAAKLDPNKDHTRIIMRSAKHLWPMHSLSLKIGFALSVVFLIASKLVELGTPLAMKKAVDDLGEGKFPLSAVIMYGAFRFGAELFAQLRDICFASTASQTERVVSLDLFRHLQSLSLEFHLHRETGGVLRSVSRGASSFGSLLRVVLFNLLPVLLQTVIVSAYLFSGFVWYFGVIVVGTVSVYFVNTYYTTEWRNAYRREMNACDNDFNQKSADALLNFETVKYFNAEEHEAQRIDSSLAAYAVANTKTQRSRAFMHTLQSLIITAGVVACMILAAKQVADGMSEPEDGNGGGGGFAQGSLAHTIYQWSADTADSIVETSGWGSATGSSSETSSILYISDSKSRSGRLTTGDFVMIQAFILQLFAPLMALGMYYAQLRQAIVDVESLMELLETPPDVVDKPDAIDFPASDSDSDDDDNDGDDGDSQSLAWADPESRPLKLRKPASLEFRNVRFRYQSSAPGSWILDGVSFFLPAGKKLAIVGSTGAGKSTIARLIYRFYDIQDGQILLDGVDIATVKQYSLRSQIAIVPQDTVLFNDTLAYNIAYGRAGFPRPQHPPSQVPPEPAHRVENRGAIQASSSKPDLEQGLLQAEQARSEQPVMVQDQSSGGAHNEDEDDLQHPILLPGLSATGSRRLMDDVVSAAKSAQLHDMILRQPQQYQTKVGERGLRLSGGEKQRASLARALLKKPKLFIFDEATSALDSRTEAEIQLALDSASVGRTTITIAHRLSTVKHCDCILVLAKGKIVEQGTHEELLEMRGQYRKMWDVQQRIELHKMELQRMESLSLNDYADADQAEDLQQPSPSWLSSAENGAEAQADEVKSASS